MLPYSTVRCNTVSYGTMWYGTIPYGIVRYGDVRITKDSVITKLIRYFELGKNCLKIKVLSVMMRTREFGNVG
jgi:hypothetical protein